MTAPVTRIARRNRGLCLRLGVSLVAALLGVASCSDKRPLILVSVSRTAEVQADSTISVSFDERIVDNGVPLPSPGSFVDHGYWLANWDGGVVRVHLALNGQTSADSACDFDWTNAASGKIIWIAGLPTATCPSSAGGQGGAAGTGGQTDAGTDMSSNPLLGGRGGGEPSGTAGAGGMGGAAGGAGRGGAGGAGGGVASGPGTGGVGGTAGGTGAGTGGSGGVGGRTGSSGGGPATGGLAGGGGVSATGGVGAAGSGASTGGMVGTGGIVGTGGMVATGGAGGAGGGAVGTGGAAGAPVNCNPPGTGGQAGAASGGAGGAGCSLDNPTAICSCTDYCAAFTKNCQGGKSFPMNDCVESCGSFHWQSSTFGDVTQGLSCRATYAIGGGMMGCQFASPTGGDGCGSYCDDFCQTVEQNCGSLNPYGSRAVCLQACQSFAHPDERLAICGNTYNCRLYWAAEAGRAGAGQANACQYAGVNSPACQ